MTIVVKSYFRTLELETFRFLQISIYQRLAAKVR